MKGKRIFEQNFSVVGIDGKEMDLEIFNSNSNINRIEDKENKDNISNVNEKENKKLLLNDDNILVTQPKEVKYKKLKTEYIDKSCQFKNRENYMRKNNFFRINSKLKFHKTNNHS